MKVGTKVKILRELDDVYCKDCEGVIISIKRYGGEILIFKVEFINNKGEKDVCLFFDQELEELK